MARHLIVMRGIAKNAELKLFRKTRNLAWFEFWAFIL